MSSPTPSSPIRRKSGSVGGAPSPERRRSNRLASISSVQAEPEPEAEVEPDQAANDASTGRDQSENKLPTEDDASPSDDSAGKADDAKHPPTPLSTRFNPWNFGEKPCTIRRVYLNSEKEDDDNDVEESGDDGKKDEEKNDKDEDKAGDEEDTNGVDDENDEIVEELETIKTGRWEDWRRDSQGGSYNKVIDPLPDFRDQPSARSSNAQTVPPIYEDRGIKFTPGDRYVQNPDGTQIDQEKHLFLKLVDMRSKSRNDKEPKRQLVIWHNKNGAPKDWKDKYAIKKLNAAHQENIRSICRDFTWSQSEADFIAQQFKDSPNMSIRELAYHFNNYFIGDFHLSSPEEWDAVHTGRTIESIRSEYLAHQHGYDNGEAPKKSELRGKYFMHANGLSEEQMKNSWKSAQGVQAPAKVTKPGTQKDKTQSKPNKINGPNAGKKDDQVVLPKIKNKEDYKNYSVTALKELAKATKPAGFLSNIRRRSKIIAKFKSTHDDDGDGDADTDSDEEVEETDPDDANDGDIKVPRYQKGDEKGLPHYNKMKAEELKQLAAERGVQLPDMYTKKHGSVRARKEDWIRHLKSQDTEKGRYKKATDEYAMKKATKAGDRKRKTPRASEQESNKKQKTKESEDTDEATDDDVPTVSPSSSKRRLSSSTGQQSKKKQKTKEGATEYYAPIASPSSPKRKSSMRSEGRISSRKSSLRNSNSRNNSTAVAVEESTPATGGRKQQLDGEDEDSYQRTESKPLSDVDNEQSEESEVSDEE
ncbi:hypothetical protein PMIN02_004376 [Paraphaeosphaeria minitans]|uniref:Uncharacterized protein n=1 Tax=Paraphaeosphaeria minitans TaxID=565426 RepID=A0A9P6GVJ4_9PLEO|nr:hypothetical protein PMIN01_00889 [Paraphaeosphaeria minitans]